MAVPGAPSHPGRIRERANGVDHSMSGRGIVAPAPVGAERVMAIGSGGDRPADPRSAPPDTTASDGRRARLVGVGALAVSVLIVVGLALLGRGTSDTTYDFESPGVWLATTARGQKITHIALATGAPDARIDVSATFPAGFVTAADAHLTVLRSSGGTCHLDRLDEAKLNLAKRDPRLELGPGPCERHRVAVGGDRIYVADDRTGRVRQLRPDGLPSAAPDVEVPIPLVDLAVSGEGLLVVISGDEGRTLRAVRDGEVVRASTVSAPSRLVLAGTGVVLVDGRGVTVLDDEGGPGRRTELRPGVDLAEALPDQPTNAIAVPTPTGGMVVVDARGDVLDVPTEATEATGAAVVLGDVVYRLGPDGASRSALDGTVLDPLSSTGGATPAELVDARDDVADGDDYEAVVSHGRLWIHRPGRSRGWGCDADGSCRAFEKNSRTTPEVTATQPDEPDPPRTVDPATTTSAPRTTPSTAPPATAPPISSSTTTAPTTPPVPAVVAPPGPVVDLAADPLDGGAALRWRPPTSGGPPDRYHVDVLGAGELAGVPTRPGRDGTVSMTVGGLTNGRTVDVEVWASTAGVAGPRARVSVTPNSRTPTDVRASIRQSEICAALGEGPACGAGAAPDAVLLRWTDAPGATGYRAGCDAEADEPRPTLAVGPGAQQAVVSAPPGSSASCWVAADGGGRTTAAGAPLLVVGLPEITVAVGDSATGRAFAVASITAYGGTFTEIRVDDQVAAVDPTGRIDLSDRASGVVRVTAAAENDRGTGRSPDVEVIIAPGAVSDLEEITPRTSCCTLEVRWIRVAGDEAGYEVAVSDLTATGCDPTCIASPDESIGFDVDLGTHASVWAVLVGRLGLAPDTPYGEYVFDVTTSVSITVRAQGSTATATSLAVAVTPSTPVALTAGAVLHPDETLDPDSATDAGGASASASCALRQGDELEALAVRTADGRTGWVRPEDAPLPDPDAIPDC